MKQEACWLPPPPITQICEVKIAFTNTLVQLKKKIHAKQCKPMALLIFQWPGGALLSGLFWEITHHVVIRQRESHSPLFWEQSTAVWILIKFIKQITQRLREAGVHLPALQIDLCRDANWMVVKAKLQSSADGLPVSSEGDLVAVQQLFSPSSFLFLATVIEEALLCLFSASSAPCSLSPPFAVVVYVSSD